MSYHVRSITITKTVRSFGRRVGTPAADAQSALQTNLIVGTPAADAQSALQTNLIAIDPSNMISTDEQKCTQIKLIHLRTSAFICGSK